MDADSSGVSEFLRLMVVVVGFRGRFCPAIDLGTGTALGGAVGAFWAFLGGASGAGHSTSWDKSRREAGTHSRSESVISFFGISGRSHHRDVC